ncbi:hypothetical protein GCM10010405_14960 [Streptomyces macrosporus]|uniref:Uncharacterized protein n=1 Tax=Streptomyces macrosporus TaxID=44032 RepID=A0ABP5WUQ2_9ACTN
MREGSGEAEAPGRSGDFEGGEDARVGAGGLGRWVESVLGSTVGDGDTGSSEIRRARGGSYEVPDTTVCTPYQDSVTAAPVASAHAPAWVSPRRIPGTLTASLRPLAFLLLPQASP